MTTPHRPRCKSCRFWDQRYPQNEILGACRHLSVLLWPDKTATVSVVPAVEAGMTEPHGDTDTVNTLEYFGCAEHSDYQL